MYTGEIHARRKYFLINFYPSDQSSSGQKLNRKQFQVRELSIYVFYLLLSTMYTRDGTVTDFCNRLTVA